MRKLYRSCFALGILLFGFYAASVFSPSLYAQTTYGSIAGVVADSSGAAISGAEVTLTNTGTAEKRVQQTGPDGLYSFVNLLPDSTASTSKSRDSSASLVRT